VLTIARNLNKKENKMKITKRQLLRIIKEEKAGLIAQPKQRKNKVKVTKRQLLRIIKESWDDESISQIADGEKALNPESKFVNAAHPLLRDSYPGNGYVLSTYTQHPEFMAWLESNAFQSDHGEVLLSILKEEMPSSNKGTSGKLYYVPFKFGDDAMDKLSAYGLPPKLRQEVESGFYEDNEYNAPGW